jgi:phenylpropionate dioxygenase-like ring-hydroxylating dioxygenase large terminal subunit
MDQHPKFKKNYAWAVERLIENLRDETVQQESEILRVPAEAFTSRERAQAEREICLQYPVVVGHHSDLPQLGSFFTKDVMGRSIIVTRREDGSVAAYLNLCRHRGGKVEQDERGSKRVFTCHYHGWTYNRDDGSLRNVPFAEDFGDIDRACYGLKEVKLEERHGMLWADFSNDPDRTVDSYLGSDVTEALEAADIDDSVLHIYQHLEIDANWKLVMDGTGDNLHVKFLHPQGVNRFLVTGRNAYLRFGRHGQNFTPRRRMERVVQEGEELDGVWRYVSSSLRLYPNGMSAFAPDHIEFWTVWPSEDPSHSTIEIRLLVSKSRYDDEIAGRVDRSWEVLREAALNEDFPMEVFIQQNAVANPGSFFTYGRNEGTIRHLHDCLEEDLAERERRESLKAVGEVSPASN